MKNQIGDDDRLKPDDWQWQLCKNCEHLEKCEGGSFYCGLGGHNIDSPEVDKCDAFKIRYR